MADFIMIMKGHGPEGGSPEDWPGYIDKLVATGTFRGGSAFGNGRCLSKKGSDNKCTSSGFMRFEADSIEEIQALVADNPVYMAGGEIELHELVVT